LPAIQAIERRGKGYAAASSWSLDEINCRESIDVLVQSATKKSLFESVIADQLQRCSNHLMDDGNKVWRLGIVCAHQVTYHAQSSLPDLLVCKTVDDLHSCRLVMRAARPRNV
jgi:hypothetical protein